MPTIYRGDILVTGERIPSEQKLIYFNVALVSFPGASACCLLPLQVTCATRSIDRSIGRGRALPAGWPTPVSVQQIKSSYYKSIMDLDRSDNVRVGIWHMTFLGLGRLALNSYKLSEIK